MTVSFHFLVHRCNALQLSQLCIATGQAVWVVYADLVFLSFDGNALDVALHALLAALESRTQNSCLFYYTIMSQFIVFASRIPLLCADFEVFRECGYIFASFAAGDRARRERCSVDRRAAARHAARAAAAADGLYVWVL